MRTRFPLALIGVLAALLSACAPPLHFGQAFHVAQQPEAQKKAPLSVAIVRRPHFAKFPGMNAELNSAVDKALFDGLREATSAMVRDVAVLDEMPAAGFDAVVQVSDFYKEVDPGPSVTLSMDVTILRLSDGHKIGMLVEGIGRPGPRPIATWMRDDGEYGVMGSTLRNPREGQAINNALFALIFDFAQKFDRRLGQLANVSSFQSREPLTSP